MVLECTVVPAPAIRVGRGPVIKRIMIDVPVVSVEAVVARIGAAVAPVVTVPACPDMTLAEARPEISRCRRSAGTAEDGSAQCSRYKMPFHDDAQSPMKPGLSLTTPGVATQIKTAALVKHRTRCLLNGFGSSSETSTKTVGTRIRVPATRAGLSVSFAITVREAYEHARNCESRFRGRCLQGGESCK